MKITVLFLAVLGLCHGATYVLERETEVENYVDTKNLNDLFQQFVDMIPFDKCVEIVNKYVANNPDVKQAYDFIRSDDFEALLTNIEQLPEYKEFVKYLYDSGFDYYKYLNLIRKVLNLPPRQPPTKIAREDPGIIQMIKEILGTLPIEDMRKWYVTVCVPDPDFQALMARIRSPEFMKLVEFVYTSQQYLEMKDILLSQGIDVDQIEDAIADFLNNARTEIRTLNDLMKQFTDMIPMDKVIEIAKKYLENDPDVQQALWFLQSDELKKMNEKFLNTQEYKDFVQFLKDSGLVIDIPPKHNAPSVHLTHKNIARAESGVIRMIKEILAALPVEKMKDWYFNVCVKDPEFQHLLEVIHSAEFKKLFDNVYNTPEYNEMKAAMLAHGIDLEQIWQIVKDFFSWMTGLFPRVAPRNLDDLLQQLANFIPFDECVAIVKKHLENDPDVQAAWKFLQSEEFQQLRDKVRSMQEYKDFVKYLSDAGLNLYDYINAIRKAFGLPPISPPRHLRMVRAESGIIVMIKEMLATLPVEDIKKWFYDVCVHDPSFIDFVNKIQSPEFLNIVESVYGSQEYKDMTDLMRSQGIDVDQIEQVIRDFLEGNIGPRNHIGTKILNDRFKEFFDMIPMDKVTEIAKNYLENDPDVQQAVAYMQTNEVKEMNEKFQNTQEFKDFLQYLKDSGLITEVPPKYNAPSVHLTHKNIARTESGIIRMIKEILATLPVEKMKDWYFNVCIKDPEFQHLLEVIHSAEFKKLWDKLYSTPEYNEIKAAMLAHGIDVDQISQIIKDFFSWMTGLFPRVTPRNLDDLLQQLANFIPFDECVAIVKKHLENDPDVQAAWKFLQSEEFQQLRDKVRSMQEYKDFVKYLSDAGLNLYDYINVIRKAFGLPPISPPRHLRMVRAESGIIVMIKEMLATLPVEDIKKWFYDVCVHDPSFIDFVNKIQSPEFLKIVESVYGSQEYKDMTDLMRAQGIDVDQIEQVIRDFLEGNIGPRKHILRYI